MQHVLLTRYNLPTDYGADAGVDPLSDDWLDHRADLFRTFCLPSVAAQTCKDFRWFLFFSPGTPTRHFGYLGDGATIIVAEDIEAALDKVRGVIEPDLVASSRLDNDDAIAPDYIERLQATIAKASTPGPYVIDFANSARFSMSLRASKAYRWHTTSSFITLVEPLDDARQWRSVFSFSHDAAAEQYPVTMVDTEEPMTLAVIHDRNLSNPWPRRGELIDLSNRFPGIPALPPDDVRRSPASSP